MFTVLQIKRARPRNKFITQYRISYVIYILLNVRDFTINLSMHAYGNRQNATKFTRANNSDLMQALKQLMETNMILV